MGRIRKAATGSLPRNRILTVREKYNQKNGKLTQEVMDEMISLIQEGLPLVPTCGYVGITFQTFLNWMNEGRKYLSGELGEEYAMQAVFLDRVERAKASWQRKLIARSLMCEEYKVGWVRDMTILERRDRENWGRQEAFRSTETKYDPDEKFL